MKNATVFGVLLLLLLSLVSAATVSAEISTGAVPLSIDQVKINGDRVEPNDRLVVERSAEGKTKVDISLKLSAQEDVDDFRVEARLLSGYEHESIRDESGILNAHKDDKFWEKLSLELPDDLDAGDYRLQLTLWDGEHTPSTRLDYTLRVDVPRHAVSVDRVSLSRDEVPAGGILYVTVKAENKGELSEDVDVVVSLDLGEDSSVQAEDSVGRLKAGEKKSSEQLELIVPRCAKAGQYDLTVTLEFNDGRDSSTATKTVSVVDGGLCRQSSAAKAEVTFGATSAEARAGARATFPVTLKNTGSEAATYSLSVSGADWATVEWSTANVLTVQPGQQGTALLYVSPKSGASEQNSLTLTVKEGENTLTSQSLNVSVEGSDWVTAVVVAIVVIIVILVIIGIVVGVSRARGSEDEEEASYY